MMCDDDNERYSVVDDRRPLRILLSRTQPSLTVLRRRDVRILPTLGERKLIQTEHLKEVKRNLFYKIICNHAVLPASNKPNLEKAQKY
jgi:hypothetical protein